VLDQQIVYVWYSTYVVRTYPTYAQGIDWISEAMFIKCEM